jgi:cytochrome c553
MNGSIRAKAIVLLATALIVSADARAQLASAPDTIGARVQGCATCHGRAGEGSRDENFPRIAGKPAGYLFNQLQNFREGRRSYPPMNYLLAYLHDDYFQEMANFFAAQRLPFAKPEHNVTTAAATTAGEQLVHRGDSTSGIPPCVACHGPRLTGIQPGIPGLVGLHSRYISAQLEAWRAGTRHAKSPDCMQEIAARLTEAQITQISAYLAAQPVSDAVLPAPQGTWKTPLSCGSQP